MTEGYRDLTNVMKMRKELFSSSILLMLLKFSSDSGFLL